MTDHTIDRAQRCAVQAGVRGDPMLGTAFPASRLLLVEQPGPWGRTGLLDSRFDRAAAHRLIAQLDPRGIRVVAIRRPGRVTLSGSRRWAAVDCRPGRERLIWGRFSDDHDLLELDVPAILDTPEPVTTDGDRRPGPSRADLPGRDPGDDRPGDDLPGDDTAPLFAVCAHGTHDVCCAIRGRPVAAALEAVRPGRVWECTHVGGDRFAANVLVLPTGMLYGRFVATSAQALADAADRGDVLEQHLRGRVGFAPDAQAAMAFVHQLRPGLAIDDVRLVRSRRIAGDVTEVRLRLGPRTVDVQVRVESTSTEWLTCQAAQPARANVYQPLSLVEVPIVEPVG